MKKLQLIKHNYPGKLIVFEGTDGAGKTTLARQAHAFLQSKGYACVAVKMPSDRVKSTDLFSNYDNSNNPTTRQLINLTNLTIFVTGDRLLTQDSEIIPALKQGKIVICDRYCYTGLAHDNSTIIISLCKRFLQPDATIYARVSMPEAKKRVKARRQEANNYFSETSVVKQIACFDEMAKFNNFFIINTESNASAFNQLEHALIKALNINN